MSVHPWHRTKCWYMGRGTVLGSSGIYVSECALDHESAEFKEVSN